MDFHRKGPEHHIDTINACIFCVICQAYGRMASGSNVYMTANRPYFSGGG